ncbi:MAG: hypothetical protein OXH84_00370 [Gammaproteobacteria bacterium]|nr:hypothetical protein [Gammaproteobacteria bacterium]
MFVLFGYRKTDTLNTVYDGPLDQCDNESEIDNMVKKHLRKDSFDYIKVDHPHMFSLGSVAYKYKGFVVVENKVMPNKIQGTDYLCRYDRFFLEDWRNSSSENEREFRKLTKIVCKS